MALSVRVRVRVPCRHDLVARNSALLSKAAVDGVGAWAFPPPAGPSAGPASAPQLDGGPRFGYGDAVLGLPRPNGYPGAAGTPSQADAREFPMEALLC